MRREVTSFAASPSRVPGVLRRAHAHVAVAAVCARLSAAHVRRTLSGSPCPPDEARSLTLDDSLRERPTAPEVGHSGVRAMHVVAHPDDDLIFLSPDLLDSVRAGSGVLTVCVTSGDAGHGVLYARAREEGLRRAYARAAGVADRWDVSVADAGPQTVKLHVLRAPIPVVLVFLRMPDGGMSREVALAEGRPTLERLMGSEATRLRVLGARALVSWGDLVEVLTALMRGFGPDEVRTMDFVGSFDDGDHSDHHACAHLTRLASGAYERTHTLKAYAGYPSEHAAPNLRPDHLHEKVMLLRAYASGDRRFRLDARNAAWAQRQYVVFEERQESRRTSAAGSTSP